MNGQVLGPVVRYRNLQVLNVPGVFKDVWQVWSYIQDVLKI